MDLKELIGEDLFNQVQAKIGDKKLIVNDGSYIPKSKFDEKNEELKTLRNEISTRDTQLEDLKKNAGNSDELTKKIQELTDVNNQTKVEYDNKIKDMTLNTAIEGALRTKNAKYLDLLAGKVDKSKLSIDSDNIIGLDEQIKNLEENYKDMFTVKVTGSTPQTGILNQGSEADQLDSAMRKAAGLE